MLNAIAEFLFKIGVALGLFAAGINEEKKRQAIKEALAAHDEAQKWADKPVNRSDTVKRLRKRAKRKD